MIDTGLENKVVLVTGANNPYGIGAGAAKAFAAQGASIGLHYFRASREPSASSPEVIVNEAASPGEAFYYAQQAKAPDEVLQAIRDLGAQAQAWEADLSDSTAIPA